MNTKPDKATLRERIANQFDKAEEFTKAQFLASMLGHKGNITNGHWDVTFTVAPGEIPEARSLMLAGDELLLVTVERVRYDGGA